MDMLDRMLGHDAWATGLLLEASAGLTNDQIAQPFDVGHGSVHATLAHLVETIDYWVAQIEQRPFQIDDASQFSIDELAEIHEQVQATFATAARSARDAGRLDELFTDAHGYPQSIGGTTLHLIYHNVIHRSEVQHMLRRLGVDVQPEGDPQEWEYGMRERSLL